MMVRPVNDWLPLRMPIAVARSELLFSSKTSGAKLGSAGPPPPPPPPPPGGGGGGGGGLGIVIVKVYWPASPLPPLLETSAKYWPGARLRLSVASNGLGGSAN